MAMRDDWTALEKLIFLRGSGAAGGAGGWSTISGNPVSFTAKAAPLRQLEVAFSPKQDLHGYDSPWPAGGGVNKLPKCVAGTYTSGGCTVVVADDGTMTLSGTSGDTSTNISIPLVEAVYTPTEDFYLHFLNSDAMGAASLAVENSASQSATTIYGTLTPVNRISSKYTGGSLGAYVNRIRIWIAANTTISGTVHPMFCLDNTVRPYSPYSNECPISGWDSLNVEQAQTEWKNVGGYWYAKTDYPTRLSIGELLPIEPNTSYTVTIAGNLRFAVQQYNNTDESQTTNAVLVDSGWRTETYTFTSHQSANYVWLLLSSPNYSFNITPADGYAQGLTMAGVYPTRSISITLGSTVYSGTVDVVSGKLVVTKSLQSFANLSELSWYKLPRGTGAFYYGRTAALPGAKFPISSINCPFSSVYLYSRSGEQPNYSFRVSDALYIVDRRFETINEFKEYLAEVGGGICYELATPIEIQLTPQEVESLAGDNVLFSDSNGDLTVTYRSN